MLSLVALLVAVYYSGNNLFVLGTLIGLFGFGTGSLCWAGREMNYTTLAGCVVAMINSGDALFGAVTEPLVGKMLDVFWNVKVMRGVHYFGAHDYASPLACYRYMRHWYLRVTRSKTVAEVTLK